MYEKAVSALESAHEQLTAFTGTPESTRARRQCGAGWATPMIGQNDVADEVFTLADAEQLSAYARAKGVGRLSMWSLNRDRECGSDCPDVRVVSTSCSGASQDQAAFARALGESVRGHPDAGPPKRPSHRTPAPPRRTIRPPVPTRSGTPMEVPGRDPRRLASQCLRRKLEGTRPTTRSSTSLPCHGSCSARCCPARRRRRRRPFPQVPTPAGQRTVSTPRVTECSSTVCRSSRSGGPRGPESRGALVLQLTSPWRMPAKRGMLWDRT